MERLTHQVFSEVLSREQVIFGVHIRRGDYKEYRNGAWYFEDDVYINYIKQFLQMIEKECKIILFTNDQEFNFCNYQAHFDNILLNNGSVSEDHYLMSQCDYLIGPTSTFSLWASYMGGAKLYHLRRADEIVSLDKFIEYKTLANLPLDRP